MTITRTKYRYLLPEEVAEVLMLRLDEVFDRVASGELVAVKVPGNGLVVPLPALPPFSKTTEHER